MSFPEWIKKTTVKSGPCRMCGPKCNDADMLFKALEIAWEALEKNANEDYRGNRSTASVRSYEALKKIEDLGAWKMNPTPEERAQYLDPPDDGGLNFIPNQICESEEAVNHQFYEMSDKMTGWECPKCGTCYSPPVSQCKKCTGFEIYSTRNQWLEETFSGQCSHGHPFGQKCKECNR